jgi:hypothetical protein
MAVRKLPNDTPSRIEDLDTVFLECRDYMHAWKLDFLEPDGVGSLTRQLHCTRCKAERTDVLDRRDGSVYSRYYKHPKGYLLTNAPPDLLRKQHARLELFKRLLG